MSMRYCQFFRNIPTAPKSTASSHPMSKIISPARNYLLCCCAGILPDFRIMSSLLKYVLKWYRIDGGILCWGESLFVISYTAKHFRSSIASNSLTYTPAELLAYCFPSIPYSFLNIYRAYSRMSCNISSVTQL